MNVSNGEMESLNKMLGEKPTQPWINNEKCDFERTPSANVLIPLRSRCFCGGFPWISICFWVNIHHDLTANPGMVISKGNHPQNSELL